MAMSARPEGLDRSRASNWKLFPVQESASGKSDSGRVVSGSSKGEPQTVHFQLTCSNENEGRWPVTAEAAGSSPVVPAISNQALREMASSWRRHKKVPNGHDPKCLKQRPYASRLNGAQALLHQAPFLLFFFLTKSDTTAVCAARFSLVTAWV